MEASFLAFPQDLAAALPFLSGMCWVPLRFTSKAPWRITHEVRLWCGEETTAASYSAAETF